MKVNRKKVYDILYQLRLDIAAETIRSLKELEENVGTIDAFQNRLDKMNNRATDDIERLYEAKFKAAEQLCQIYFEIAVDEIGEKAVRAIRDAAIDKLIL